MRVIGIVQARTGSARLPGKVLRKTHGMTLIEILLRRLSSSEELTEIVVAIPDGRGDDRLNSVVEAAGFPVFRGDERDVLGRFYGAATNANADLVVRITGDCPVIDPGVVDEVTRLATASNAVYASNVEPPTFPDGLDVEVFTIGVLREAHSLAHDPHDREHVTPFIRRSAKAKANLVSPIGDMSAHRWTVDDVQDLETVDRVISRFFPRWDFTWREVIEWGDAEPNGTQASDRRNEGAHQTNGQKLWSTAQRLIAGGTMLLTKNPDRILPDRWPAYFSRAAGCRVWDLDANEYLDCAFMGVGTNILGYGHPEVDAAASEAIRAGNMSSLLAPEEVHLASRLLDLHPWAAMARFTRSGGEAMAVAVRLARARSQRDQVAICGYHGWHDWYLAANLEASDQLDGHLLPGLNPAGVPGVLRGTASTFKYNDRDGLDRVLQAGDIGVIVMEVTRSVPPAPGFLEGVRERASENGIVLVFDEITSGFRHTLGGSHLEFGVIPDVVVLGKALGNGYAIAAVLGTEDVMACAESSFISSTFWTERLGAAAALRTLDVMERDETYTEIQRIGRSIKMNWSEMAGRHGLAIEISGMDAIPAFTVAHPDWPALRTLVSQEMLRAGILATNAMYVSISHTPDVVDRYLESLDSVFGLIAECVDGRPVAELLEVPVAESGFGRLN